MTVHNGPQNSGMPPSLSGRRPQSSIGGVGRGTIGEAPKYSLSPFKRNRGVRPIGTAASVSAGVASGTANHSNSFSSTTVSKQRSAPGQPIANTSVSALRSAALVSSVGPSNHMKSAPFQKLPQQPNRPTEAMLQASDAVKRGYRPLSSVQRGQEHGNWTDSRDNGEQGHWGGEPSGVFVDTTGMTVKQALKAQQKAKKEAMKQQRSAAKETKRHGETGNFLEQPTDEGAGYWAEGDSGSFAAEKKVAAAAAIAGASAVTAAASSRQGLYDKEKMSAAKSSGLVAPGSGTRPGQDSGSVDASVAGAAAVSALAEGKKLPDMPDGKQMSAKARAKARAKELQQQRKESREALKEKMAAEEQARAEERAIKAEENAWIRQQAEEMNYTGQNYDGSGHDGAWADPSLAGGTKESAKEIKKMEKNMKKLEKMRSRADDAHVAHEKAMSQHMKTLYGEKSCGTKFLQGLGIFLIVVLAICAIFRCQVIQYLGTTDIFQHTLNADFMDKHAWLKCNTCNHFKEALQCQDLCTREPENVNCAPPTNEVTCNGPGDPDKNLCTCDNQQLANHPDCDHSITCEAIGVPDVMECTCEKHKLPGCIECKAKGDPDPEYCNCQDFVHLEGCKTCIAPGDPEPYCTCEKYKDMPACCIAENNPSSIECTCEKHENLPGCDRPRPIKEGNTGIFFGATGPNSVFQQDQFDKMYEAGMSHFLFVVHGTWTKVDLNTILMPAFNKALTAGVKEVGLVAFLNRDLGGSGKSAYERGALTAQRAVENAVAFADASGHEQMRRTPIYVLAIVIVCETYPTVYCLNYKGETSTSQGGGATNKISEKSSDQSYNCQMLLGFLDTVKNIYTKGPEDPDRRAGVMIGTNAQKIFGNCDMRGHVKNVIFHHKNFSCMSDCLDCGPLLDTMLGKDIDIVGNYRGLNPINKYLPLPNQDPYTRRANTIIWYNDKDCSEL